MTPNKLEEYQKEHIADTKPLGFDYQFYYFMYLTLRLKPGEEVGFEVMDDIHIEKDNGDIELFQLKHSVQTKADGDIVNVAELDSDLWKTISFWAECIKISDDKDYFLKKHSFHLVTNKSEGTSLFISKLNQYRQDPKVENFNGVMSHLKHLISITTDNTIKTYINTIFKLSQKNAKIFLYKIVVVTDQTRIIERIKNVILEKIVLKERVDAVYDSLHSNLQTSKYLEILDRQKFIISFDDFSSKYAKCFEVGFNQNIIPIRNFHPTLPNDLENQIFIKQLVDIGDVSMNERDLMIRYTTSMLNAFNNLKYWEENYIILKDEKDNFCDNAWLDWHNIFRKHYRNIKNQITNLSDLELEKEIVQVALNCIDEIRTIKLSLQENDLGTDFSNGYYYMLSEESQIGWHFNWEEKYKKK